MTRCLMDSAAADANVSLVASDNLACNEEAALERLYWRLAVYFRST